MSNIYFTEPGLWICLVDDPETNEHISTDDEVVHNVTTFVMWLPKGWMMLVKSALRNMNGLREIEGKTPLPIGLSFIPDEDHLMRWRVFGDEPANEILLKPEEEWGFK